MASTQTAGHRARRKVTHPMNFFNHRSRGQIIIPASQSNAAMHVGDVLAIAWSRSRSEKRRDRIEARSLGSNG
jgi:hypothetical protein